MTQRHAAKRIGLALASTALALVLAEVALSTLSIGDPILRDVDPVLGWAPIPGAEGWWTREGRAYVRITEHGFRGVDRPREKPEGVLRVAILGDSYTEAKQVALHDTYFSQAERELNTCLGRPVEVLSFGVSGYGTAQERVLLEHRVWAYSPDVVLLAFLTGNDVADNHPRLRASGQAPFYRVEGGELVLDESFLRSDEYLSASRGGPWRWLQRRSRLVRVISSLSRPERAGRGELGLRDEVYLPPQNDDWREAWAWTEAILEAMNEDVRAHGARFYVTTLSNAVQVDPDPAVRERYRAAIGADDLFYPDRRVAAVGERAGFEVLTLAPALRAHAERHGVQLHGFSNTELGTGHWNERGHRAAGRRMGAWLCRRLADR